MSGPVTLLLGRLPSPLGTLLLVTDGEGGLRALDFEDFQSRMHRLLLRHYGEVATTLRRAEAPRELAHRLSAFFEGELHALASIAVKTNGSPFQQRVWLALSNIAPGTTRTYGELANALGQPQASRAVGLANGANPVAIVVPCHRVIGASGKLTGYAGGLARKQWLLQHEQR